VYFGRLVAVNEPDGLRRSALTVVSKPNAVRRGANHHKVRRQAWFARGLTAGRLSLAVHSSARIKREPYFWRQPRETTAGSAPVGDEPTNSIIL